MNRDKVLRGIKVVMSSLIRRPGRSSPKGYTHPNRQPINQGNSEMGEYDFKKILLIVKNNNNNSQEELLKI
ncbi:hypothetical protein OUZ56_031955 [Daphnia magna]|uniref:Uncharacterized protein n=1 Tax=Daphnia magna TaxID=35525 RepID=A0ABQ9ZVQ4_9CRUS|nr:hypothetical protein OUZ56_031955 [Daphnia magna]